MNRRAIAQYVAAVLSLPAFAHHSNVAFQVTKVVTVKGVVKAFEWRNPHTWLTLEVDDGRPIGPLRVAPRACCCAPAGRGIR
ncbi:MAG TPA: DUF6152 family protein [Bryobacteraceae bacterium]|nr:DUF6152 family protein [Bryobacteraceae bacterium]